jgi:hypothetical protein
MKMKKAIIITVILLVAGIAAAIIFLPKSLDLPQETLENIEPKTGTLKIETPSADEVFYIENPDLRLENYPQYISQIGYNSYDYIGILGFSEYPLIIREDEINRFNDYPEVMSNSDGTAFLAYASIDEKRVLFYGNDGIIKKISEPNIQSAVLLSDGDEIAWLAGEDDSNKCTVKVMKNNEITILSNNAASFYSAGLRASRNTLIWYENFKQNPNGTGTYALYLRKDGKTVKLGENIDLRAYVRDGERIFYEEDYKLYVQNGFDKENRIFLVDYSDNIENMVDNTVNTENLTPIMLSQSDFSTMRLYTPNAQKINPIMLSQPDMSDIVISCSNRDYSQVMIRVSNNGGYKTYYYEEGKTPQFLINKSLEVIDPVGGTEAIDISEYYFKTENYNSSTSESDYDVYRFDGELKPVPISGVRDIMTFSDTDNFLYETDENLWIYDSKTGESVSVFEFEKTPYIRYFATPDLSVIYVRVGYQGIDGYQLYEVKSDGVITTLCDMAEGFYLDGETLYYLTTDWDLYIYENGNSEKLLSIGENHNNIDWVSWLDGESGYLKLEVWTENSQHYFYISSDGRNLVCVEEYL